jgi:hypothetical protein
VPEPRTRREGYRARPRTEFTTTGAIDAREKREIRTVD